MKLLVTISAYEIAFNFFHFFSPVVKLELVIFHWEICVDPIPLWVTSIIDRDIAFPVTKLAVASTVLGDTPTNLLTKYLFS